MDEQPGPGVLVHGARAVGLATALLQRMRLAAPEGGVWEAADVQWWARSERPTDRDGQLFWLGDGGEPEAAVLRTGFGHSVQCDVLVLPDDPGYARAVWRAAVARVVALREAAAGPATEFPVRRDDAVGAAELTAAGFGTDGEPGVVCCWLDAASRPRIPPLAPGYRLLSRAEAADGPHPLAARNGSGVERRLRQGPMYRPELDLRVVGPGGRTAGYGLFWADQVTGIGLVEPMRTEEAHQGRGLASHLLAAGLDRLAAHGCRRLKVANDLGIYLRAGFRPLPAATAAIYTLQSCPVSQDAGVLPV